MTIINTNSISGINSITAQGASGVAFYDSSGSSERLLINSAGDMGLGTGSPTNIANFTSFTLNGTTGGNIEFKDDNVLRGSVYNLSDQFIVQAQGETTPLAFRTNSTERVRITGVGSFGVGNDDPTYRVSVKDTKADGTGVQLHLWNNSVDNTVGNVWTGIRFTGSTSDYETAEIKGWRSHPGTNLNSLSINTGGVERMVLSSSGVGIGTNNPGEELHIHASGTSYIKFTDETSGVGGSDGVVFGLDHPHTYVWNYEAGDFVVATGASETFRVTDDGNLQATGASDVRLTLGSGGTAETNDSVHVRADGANLLFMNGNGGITKFEQNGTAAAQISSNGRFDVGDELGVVHSGIFQAIYTGSTALDNDCMSFFETNSDDWIMKLNFNKTNSTHYHIDFMEEGSRRGTISGADGSNVAFTPGSDYRMKENIIDLTGTDGINLVKNLKPRKYNWIDNRKNTGEINTVNGFVAHEVEEAGLGHLVYGNGKDAVNEDGSIDPQTLDYAGITPVLAAAIKGLISKVEDLEQRLSAAGIS